MKTSYKKIKKLLCAICLFECWINYYHESKKIKYVALINIIFILILTLVLSLLTYIFSKTLNNNLIVSFNIIFLLYLFILSVIAFQNLFDNKFNIACKTKILILSVFSGINIKRCIIDCVFYLFSWSILIYLLCSPADNYVRKVGIKNINENALLSLMMLIAFIIIFTIQVYGINDLYKKSKRKLLLYGISTLIALISALNSIDNMYKNQNGYIDIFNFQFITIVFALIISIDRFFTNYTTLIIEFNKNDELVMCSTICEECNIKNITFGFIYNKIISYIFKILKEIKNTFTLFKPLSIRKKLSLISYIIFSPAIIFFLFKFIRWPSQLMDALILKANTELENIFYHINLDNSKTSNILRILLKYFGKLTFIILEIFSLIICLAFITESISKIKNTFRNSTSIKTINFRILQGQLKKLSNCILALVFIIIIPFTFFSELNRNLAKIVFEVIFCIYIVIIILYFSCIIIIKIQDRIEKYTKNE